jgi:hypothetical protein
MTEKLEPRLRASALMVLRDHHIAQDELELIVNEPGTPASCLIKGHRVRIELNDAIAVFSVRTGRWRGARADYTTTGAFLAAFESALGDALAGR